MSDSRTDDGDDSLASSFVSSFSLPPPSPKPPKEKNSEAGLTDIHKDQPTLIIPASENQNEDAPDPLISSHKGNAEGDPSSVENPVAEAQGQSKSDEDWKSLLDENLVKWRAESSEARTKSESTRLRLLEEKAKADKEASEAKKADQRKAKQAQDDQDVEIKLREILNAPSVGSVQAKKRRSSQAQEDTERRRWNAVRDAWEVVRSGTSTSVVDEGECPADSRDLVAGDHGGKQDNRGPEVLQEIQRSVSNVTHIKQSDGNLDPTPASKQRRNDLLSTSEAVPSDRRDAVGKAWEQTALHTSADKGTTEPNGPPQSRGQPGEGSTSRSGRKDGSEEGVLDVSASQSSAQPSSSANLPVPAPKGTRETKKQDDEEKVEIGPIPTPSPLSGPPFQPPSLTLSLFTSPSHRSVARILAVLGINLVLPFINGVMLGFGEIFARETVIFGRRWWRGEATFRSLWRSSAGGTLAGLGMDSLVGPGGHYP